MLDPCVLSRQPGIFSTVSFVSFEDLSTLVLPKVWTLRHSQGMTSSVPGAPEHHWVTCAILIHLTASGPMAFFSQVTIGARTSLNSAYGSICCGNKAQSPFALGPTVLCSQTLPCPPRQSFFPVAGKSTFCHLLNLVICLLLKIPTPSFRRGRSRDYFSFVL